LTLCVPQSRALHTGIPNGTLGTRNAVYNIGLSQAELSLMNQWHTTNPPDAWEIERNNIIFKYQGNRNQFIN